ncbi:MAG TPA: hypothetical protein PK006_03215 [Saprospiraceae bacterium]|nr:hypothetical protein [Saprospiraceae bacterium]
MNNKKNLISKSKKSEICTQMISKVACSSKEFVRAIIDESDSICSIV